MYYRCGKGISLSMERRNGIQKGKVLNLETDPMGWGRGGSHFTFYIPGYSKGMYYRCGKGISLSMERKNGIQKGKVLHLEADPMGWGRVPFYILKICLRKPRMFLSIKI